MEIVGKVDYEKLLCVNDLSVGDIFVFLLEEDKSVFSNPCILGDDGCIVDLGNGTQDYESTYCNSPIKKIKAKLIIEN